MKVTFNFSSQQINIEGDGPELVKVLELVREIAPTLPQINIQTAGTGKPTQPEREETRENNGRRPTMREWAKKLTLGSQVEKVTAIAYYATRIEDRAAFTPKDMSTWFTHCGFMKPSQMGVVAYDASYKHGYLESAGHGQYRLTTGGENFVLGKLEEADKAGKE